MKTTNPTPTTLTPAQARACDLAASQIYDLLCTVDVKIQTLKENGLPTHAAQMARALALLEQRLDETAMEIDPPNDPLDG